MGQAVFTTPGSSVLEGNVATMICVSVTSLTATTLGCDIEITLTTTEGSAG